ncbi:hypothetical protein WMF37_08585 [Sorangium sp. So ce291]|uniref:hypothetical protein n=1 Tax=Sorangium sp. So ce291 TaxID=3133294 RepID=UPI003F6422C3
MDPQSRTVEVSAGFERMWQLRVEDLTGYLMLEDEQIVANGFMDRLARRGCWPPSSGRSPTRAPSRSCST